MNLPARPNPAQLPTLTEVIELMQPTPVGHAGLNSEPRPAPPPPGSPGSAPIVTGGLASSQAPANWTPMNTVVVQPMSAVELPVLETVVPEVSPPAGPEPESEPAPVIAPVIAPVAAASPESALPEITQAQLAQRVLSVVQKQIDGMIDFRLKEAVAPILARHTEAMVRDLREELSRTMADVVARAVAQEMAKLRQR